MKCFRLIRNNFALNRKFIFDKLFLRRQLVRHCFFSESHGLVKRKREPEMFCHHCAQTSEGLYCDKVSTCGKTPTQSNLQALIIQFNQTICQLLNLLSSKETKSKYLDHQEFLLETTFATLTNVNFSPSQSIGYINKLNQIKNSLVEICKENSLEVNSIPLVDFEFRDDLDYLKSFGSRYSVLSRYNLEKDPDVFALRELLRYGLKGVSAYYCHAERARKKGSVVPENYSEIDREEIYNGITRAWVKMEEPNLSITEMFDECMALGGVNFKVMRALFNSHVALLGQPDRKLVPTKPVPGHSILVSGHDLVDLLEILEITKDKGINVYTHGEMAPAHSYPELNKYKHLKGNLGGAWYSQKFDFKKFKGSILLTSNCLMEPRKSYRNRIFTKNSVGWEGIRHLEDDYTPLIESALKEEPFTQDFIDANYSDCKDLLIGYGKNTSVEILDAISNGHLKNVFLIGGCDGTEDQRKYFTNLAAMTPVDSVILTLGCGKFRVNQLDLGDIPNTGIPRILDIGQCNDSYTAIMIAVKLAEALSTDVNSLPLHLAVAWYEQKAIAVLMTLLHLGIKNIRIGPIIPAFLTPNVTKVLQDKFNLQLAHPKDVEGDLNKMLNKL